MDNPKDITIILQARMGASRLPGKMALSINGETIFETVIIRLLTIFPLKVFLLQPLIAQKTTFYPILLMVLASMYSGGQR